jgi:hypothetical protein
LFNRSLPVSIDATHLQHDDVAFAHIGGRVTFGLQLKTIAAKLYYTLVWVTLLRHCSVYYSY